MEYFVHEYSKGEAWERSRPQNNAEDLTIMLSDGQWQRHLVQKLLEHYMTIMFMLHECNQNNRTTKLFFWMFDFILHSLTNAYYIKENNIIQNDTMFCSNTIAFNVIVSPLFWNVYGKLRKNTVTGQVCYLAFYKFTFSISYEAQSRTF